MKRHITDNTGKQIEVTDIKAAIAQVETYTTFSNSYNKVTKAYWKDVLKKLKALKKQIDAEPIAVKVEDPIADKIPMWVKQLREERINCSQSSLKLFVKDTKLTPLYGIHSCARAERNLRVLENLEVGQSYWGGSRVITRIF